MEGLVYTTLIVCYVRLLCYHFVFEDRGVIACVFVCWKHALGYSSNSPGMLFQFLAPTPARVFVMIQSRVFPIKISSWRGSGVVIAILTWKSERAIDAIGGVESCIRIEERLKYSVDIGIMLDEMKYVKYVIVWVRNLTKFIRWTTPFWSTKFFFYVGSSS